MQDDPYAPPQQSFDLSGQRSWFIRPLLISIAGAILTFVYVQIMQLIPASNGTHLLSWRLLLYPLVVRLVPLGLIAWTYRGAGRQRYFWCGTLAVLFVLVQRAPDMILVSMLNPSPNRIRLAVIAGELVQYVIAFLLVAYVARTRFRIPLLIGCSALATVIVLSTDWWLQWVFQAQILGGNAVVLGLWTVLGAACWTLCLGLLAPLVIVEHQSEAEGRGN